MSLYSTGSLSLLGHPPRSSYLSLMAAAMSGLEAAAALGNASEGGGGEGSADVYRARPAAVQVAHWRRHPTPQHSHPLAHLAHASKGDRWSPSCAAAAVDGEPEAEAEAGLASRATLQRSGAPAATAVVLQVGRASSERSLFILVRSFPKQCLRGRSREGCGRQGSVKLGHRRQQPCTAYLGTPLTRSPPPVRLLAAEGTPWRCGSPRCGRQSAVLAVPVVRSCSTASKLCSLRQHWWLPIF